MQKKYSNLFKPIQIGNIILKNRIIAAPTGMMDLTPDGRLTPYNVSYYELKARGGAAVVTLGESITETETGESHNRQIHLDDPNSLPGLTHTVLAIQRAGALANIELSHGGKYGGLTSIAGEETANRASYGPSDEVRPNGEIVHAMDHAMIYRIVKAYGNAAKLCKKAGFDMMMVHAAHGWLFNQFLSPVENKRTDEFGGSLENRARFLLLALDAVRESVGEGFPIELRMNGDDFIQGGMAIEDYKELAKIVENKVDLINVSAGSHEAENLFVRTHPSMFLEHGCNVYLAEEIKKVVSIPVACVGGIDTPELAEDIISSGKADIVEIGRGLLADPFWPKKAKEGRSEDITPCLRCFKCFEAIVKSTVVACAVNPEIGFEFDHKYYEPKTQKVKKVLVIGAGPGGMQAAITAAEKGHHVVLCEKTDGFGGALKFAQYIDFKKDLAKFAEVLENRVKKSAIDIRLNTTIDQDYIMKESPDVVIIATGAQAIIPSTIQGINQNHVMTAMDAEKKVEELGETIAILGGGLVGCELGIHLAKIGKSVNIIEMRSEVAPEANEFHKMALTMELEKNVNLNLDRQAIRITKEGVWCLNENTEEELVKADNVIIAVGVRSNKELDYELGQWIDEVYMIGDCKKPSQVMQAVHEGYYIAREL